MLDIQCLYPRLVSMVVFSCGYFLGWRVHVLQTLRLGIWNFGVRKPCLIYWLNSLITYWAYSVLYSVGDKKLPGIFYLVTNLLKRAFGHHDDILCYLLVFLPNKYLLCVLSCFRPTTKFPTQPPLPWPNSCPFIRSAQLPQARLTQLLLMVSWFTTFSTGLSNSCSFILSNVSSSFFSLRFHF